MHLSLTCLLWCSTPYFAESSFYDLVQYRFGRDSRPGELQDVYDGRLYKMQHKFFMCKNNIPLNLNYDGASKFQSSGMQVWPIQFVINELPPNVRLSILVIKFILTL